MSRSKILLIGPLSLCSHEPIAHLDVCLLWYERFHLVELRRQTMSNAIPRAEKLRETRRVQPSSRGRTRGKVALVP